MFLRIVVAVIVALCAFITYVAIKDTNDRQHFMANPRQSEIGTFEGCEVKYIYRGSRENSFYIAKCGSTNTVTGSHDEQNGKSTKIVPDVTITHEAK